MNSSFSLVGSKEEDSCTNHNLSRRSVTDTGNNTTCSASYHSFYNNNHNNNYTNSGVINRSQKSSRYLIFQRGRKSEKFFNHEAKNTLNTLNNTNNNKFDKKDNSIVPSSSSSSLTVPISSSSLSLSSSSSSHSPPSSPLLVPSQSPSLPLPIRRRDTSTTATTTTTTTSTSTMCPNNNTTNTSAPPVISSSYSRAGSAIGGGNVSGSDNTASSYTPPSAAAAAAATPSIKTKQPSLSYDRRGGGAGKTGAGAGAGGDYTNKNDPNASQLPTFIERLSSTNQFMVLSGTMFLFFGAHNLLQEAIMKVPGFDYGVMLSYMEVLGVTACSYIERKYVAKETGNVAPLSTYPFLTFCLLSSSALSNMSLNYINFPTKAVFRSSKLIPTMLIATIINRRIFKSIEYASAFAISLGLIVFAAADWKLTPSFNPIGLALVSTSVIFDAILPNAQERNFRLGASRLEVTLYTNFFTLVTMTFTTLWSGDLISAFTLATSDHHLACFMVVYTAISYVAISSFMAIVKKYGGVTAVLLGTARKAMSLILSFLFFPKVFSWFYVLGATLVLGGLMVASLTKHYDRQSEKLKKQSCFIVESSSSGSISGTCSINSSSNCSRNTTSHKAHYVALRGSGDVERDVEMATPLLTTSR